MVSSGSGSASSRYGCVCSFSRHSLAHLEPVFERKTYLRCTGRGTGEVRLPAGALRRRRTHCFPVRRIHARNARAPGSKHPGRYTVPSRSSKKPVISEELGSKIDSSASSMEEKLSLAAMVEEGSSPTRAGRRSPKASRAMASRAERLGEEKTWCTGAPAAARWPRSAGGVIERRLPRPATGRKLRPPPDSSWESRGRSSCSTSRRKRRRSVPLPPGWPSPVKPLSTTGASSPRDEVAKPERVASNALEDGSSNLGGPAATVRGCGSQLLTEDNGCCAATRGRDAPMGSPRPSRVRGLIEKCAEPMSLGNKGRGAPSASRKHSLGSALAGRPSGSGERTKSPPGAGTESPLCAGTAAAGMLSIGGR